MSVIPLFSRREFGGGDERRTTVQGRGGQLQDKILDVAVRVKLDNLRTSS